MADDVQADISLNIDTSKALSGLKALQSELSALHTQLARLGPTQRAQATGVQRSLIDNINATGKFAASMTTVKTTAESFTQALEKNKLTMGEYFRYAGGASKSFGKNFAREFATIEKVAIERVKSLQTQYVKLGRDANGAMRAIQVRPLTLDMDNLQTKTAIAAQKQQLLNQLLKQGSTQMLNWGKNTQWAGRQLMVGFTIPLGIFAGKAMQAFSDMEKQIISFKRVYGDLSTSAKDTDAMAESIRKLAGEFTKYGLAVSDTMEMASKAAAMGKTGADLLGQVQQASKLAVLGQVEQQQALQTTISLTDTFGTAAQDLGKKINFLNAVENQTAVSIEDLTIAIPKAGPVIKQLGGDVEDLAFFLTAMREGGINASEGANALKSGLAAMINPTGKAAEMLQGFGINLKEIVKTNKGDVRGTVTEFAKALDKLDPLNRAKAIEQLFGKFQFARISTLMKNVVSDSSQAATTAQLAQKSSVELAALAARELRQLSASPLYKFQKAIQDFQTQLAPIGESFMKFVTPIIDFVNGLLKSFNSLGDGTKTFIVGFTSVVAGLGPVLLMTFGLVANGFANLIKGFAALKSMFNRVQTSSEILGQETRYMTEEQIKAKAVAASLDQVHGKLIQTFNVEAGSVNKLASAYERAILASQRLMPVATGGKGKTTRAKKFAQGGMIYGPGTGTSDSIPAMVSNGEFIMPAKQTARYRPFLDAMSENKLPGFAGKNGNVVGEKRRIAKGTVKAHLQDKLDLDDPEVLDAVLRRYPQFAAVPQAVRDRMFFSGSLTADLPRQLNEDIKLQKGGVSPDKFEKIWSGSSDKLTGTAIAAGLDPRDPEQVKALRDIETKIGKRAAALARAAGGKVTDTILTTATSEVIAETKKSKRSAVKKLGAALQTRSRVLGDYRTNYTKKELEAGLASGQFVMRGKQIIDPASGMQVGDMRSSSSGRNKTGASQRTVPIPGGYTTQPYYGTSAEDGDVPVSNSRSQSAKKKTAEANEAAAKSAESTAKSEKQIAKETLARAKEKKAAGKRMSKAEKEAYEAYVQRQEVGRQRRSTTIASRKAKSQAQQDYMVREYGTTTPSQQMIIDKRNERKEKNRQRKIAGKNRAEQRAKASKPTSIFGLGKESRDARASRVGTFIGGGRGFGLGSAISIGGSMLGSAVGGEAGGSIQQNSMLLGGVLAVADFFPKLATGLARFIPQIAIASAAIGALGLIVEKVTEKERKRSEAIANNAEASGVSNTTMGALTEFFGSDQITGSYFSTPILSGGSSSLGPVVDELRQNEGFKTAMKDEKWADALKTGTAASNKALLESLAIRFGADLGPDAVRAIIAAIQAEANVTPIAIDFASIDVKTKEGREGIVKSVKQSFDALKAEGQTAYESGKAQLEILTPQLKAAQNASDRLDADPYANDAQKSEARREVERLREAVAAQQTLVDMGETNANVSNLAKDTANRYQAALFAVTAAYQKGNISEKEYLETMKSLKDEFNSYADSNLPRAEAAVNAMIDANTGLNDEQKNTIKSLKSVKDKYNAATLAITNNTKATDLATKMAGIQKAMLTATGGELAFLRGQYEKYSAELNVAAGLTPGKLPIPTTSGGGTGEDPRVTGAGKKIDKYKAGLDLIEIAEEKINKKYDKRIEALDKVQEINDQISQQQKDQLDLADALARGDIGAAARAAQTMRSNEQNLQIQKQKDGLEAARKMELDAVTDPLGRTRSYLEGKIAVLEEQIARINFWNSNKKKGVAAANGGIINTYRPGGKVTGPGTGTSDDIPAMLSNGEYVIRAKAVKALGVDTLDKMNHAEKFGIGGFARRYAKGGSVDRLRSFRIGEHKNPPIKPSDILKKKYQQEISKNPLQWWEFSPRKSWAKWQQSMGNSIIRETGKTGFRYRLFDSWGYKLDPQTGNRIEDVPYSKEYLDSHTQKYAKGGSVDRLRSFRNSERKYAQPSKVAPLVLPQMLKGTKLSARTTHDALLSMILEDGRYKNAFETGSGEDFKDVNENSRAKWTRLNMESDALGISKLAEPQTRPTYGALVTESKILESLNRTLGGSLGKRFNLVSDINSEQLDRYGDISLITKNRVKNRSTFYTGDTLETYARNGLFGRDNFGPVPTTGKPADIFKRASLNKLAMRFGHNKIGENAYSVNNKPRYFETQTPGGFTLDDVAKIRVHSSEDAAKDVLNDLRNSGFKTKVYGPGGKRVRPSIVSTLLRSLGRIGGPEGMFLADALLGTNSMQMPTVPGQMGASPFASGAYARGGIVGPRSADAMERWKNKNAKKASPTWIKAARNAIPQGRSSEQPSAPSWWNPDAWMSDLFGLGYGAKTTPNINASVKPMTQDAAGAYVDLVSGSPWLAGQVSGKPVDASGWDALAVAGVLPLGRVAKIVNAVDTNHWGLKNLQDYVSKPLGLHYDSFRAQNVDEFIDTNSLKIPAGSDLARVTNGYDMRAMSLLKPGQSFKADRFFSVTRGSDDSFISGMRSGDINTGGRTTSLGLPYPLIKYTVKSDIPGVEDINKFSPKGQELSDVVDGMIARGNTMKLVKTTTDKVGGITYHVEVGGKSKANLGLNEILRIYEATQGIRGLAKEAVTNPRGLPASKFKEYRGLFSPDKLLEDLATTRRLENVPGMTGPVSRGALIKTYQRFLKGPELFANGGMASKIKPSYFNAGGLARGTDTIPAMLTPGEFVMSRSAVENFGVDNLKAINSGQVLEGAAANTQTSMGDSVYNSNSYSISVNVSSASDPNDIARTVMAQIQRIDAQTTRSNRY